ncbi:MAG: hypothetical protein ACXV3F_13415 [Frankiaceae bacterium]
MLTLGRHQIRLGPHWAGHHITVLLNGDRATFHALDGHPIGHLTLDRTRQYQGKITAA